MTDVFFGTTIDWDRLVADGKIVVKPSISLPMVTFKRDGWEITAPNMGILRDNATYMLQDIVSYISTTEGAKEACFEINKGYSFEDLEIDIDILFSAKISAKKRGKEICGIGFIHGLDRVEKRGSKILVFKLSPTVSDAVYEYAQRYRAESGEPVRLNYWDLVAAIVCHADKAVYREVEGNE